MTDGRNHGGRKPPPPLVSRDDVELAIWRLTKYQGESSTIDRLLGIIDEYALAHGAVLPEVFLGESLRKIQRSGASPGYVFDRVLAQDKRLRCNSCGRFHILDRMVADYKATDGVRPLCKACKSAKGSATNPSFRGQRVYRIRTSDGWDESRRIRAT